MKALFKDKMYLTAMVLLIVAVGGFGVIWTHAVLAQEQPAPKHAKSADLQPVALTPEQIDRLSRHEASISALDAQLKAAVAEYNLAVSRAREEACEAAGANPVQYKSQPEWTQNASGQRALVFLPKPKPPETKK